MPEDSETSYVAMHTFRFFLAVVILIGILAAPVSAASISIQSTHIDAGQPFRVSITDLQNNTTVALLVEGEYPARPGKQLLFQLSGFKVPFSLIDGMIVTSAGNVRAVSFSVRQGNTTFGIEATPETGDFTHTESWNVLAGNYTFMRLEAIPLDAAMPITSRIQLTGRKQGPETTNLSFIPEGIESGQIRIVILVDGVREVDQVITIGEADDIPASGQIMQSPDGIVTVAGIHDPRIEILPGTCMHIPEGWKPMTRSYRLVPDSTDLSSGTIIIFRIPVNIAAENELYTLSIARSDNNSWKVLPSRIEENGNLISAPIQSTGEYCLLAIRMPDDPVPSPTRLPLSVLTLLASLGCIAILLSVSAGTRR